MLVYTDKKKWANECAKRGAVNHLSEVNSYEGLGQVHMLEYALCSGNRGLCGVWHPVKNQGSVYPKPRPVFSTTHREFKKEKLKQYQ